MTELTPPIAAKHPITREFHGRSFVDDYEWMRDKESAETLDYLRAENAYTEQETAHLKELTENIFQEVKSRVKETDMSVPSRRGQYWYYGRSVEGKNYGISCRVPVAEDADPWTAPVIPEEGAPEGEEILLDANELAEGTEFFAMGASTVSDSGNLLAYSVDTAGDERFSLVIKDLRTGELLSDRLDGIFYGATWVGDDYIFYTTVMMRGAQIPSGATRWEPSSPKTCRSCMKLTSVSTSASAVFAARSTCSSSFARS